jgi:MFS family permease
VSAPPLGGALIDAFSWRVCYGISIPIGVISVLVAIYWMRDLYPNPDLGLSLKEKIRRLDLVGTLLVLPLVSCLMIALIWGGVKYSWKDWRIILLFSLFLVLTFAFGYVQHRQQDKAVVPPRILKNRTVLSVSLYGMCINGLLATTEYYIAIYLQGVKGYSAAKSGLLGLPMVVGLGGMALLATVAAGWVGYYTPFLYATSIFAP